jgi:hypothetical protein
MIPYSPGFEAFMNLLVGEVAGTEAMGIIILLLLFLFMGFTGRMDLEILLALVLVPFIVAAAYVSDVIGVILLIALYLAFYIMKRLLGR